MHGHRHGPRSVRTRWWSEETRDWQVHARVERFVEPLLLLVLRDGDAHGYGLADAIETLDPDERVDLGNLYRLLRALEEEGFVTSTWRDDLPGRSKRTYALTDEGRALLDAWVESLRRAQENIDGFLRRYEGGSTK
jgi:poly-beta-hydroxybutyrate-responsive repressor